MGWLTEIDGLTGVPIKKLYKAGRGEFGGMFVDGAGSNLSDCSGPIGSETCTGPEYAYFRSIIFTTQTQPAVLLRWGSYSEGFIFRLCYFYSEDAGWLVLNDYDVDGSAFPLSFDELSDIQTLALKKGATMYNRLGSIVRNSNIDLFIAETGGDSWGDAFTNPAKIYNGKLARHLRSRDTLDGTVDGRFGDPYGRILLLDRGSALSSDIPFPNPWLEGGTSQDGRYTFSNPKNMSLMNAAAYSSTFSVNNDILMVTEQLLNDNYGRNPGKGEKKEDLINEVYFINTSNGGSPDINNLRPFLIGPKGAEIQGSFSSGFNFSPLFLSIRYPNPANDAPYDKSLLIAVSNFEQYFTNPGTACSWEAPPAGRKPQPVPVDPGFNNHADDPLVDSTLIVTAIQPALGNKSTFKAWPNPTTRTLHFNQLQDVRLYDQYGRLVQSQNKTEVMDIFDISPGIYYLRNEDNQSIKVVIE